MRSDDQAQSPTALLDSLHEGVGNLRHVADLDLATPQLAELVSATVNLRNRLDSALTRLVGKLDQRMRAEQDPTDPSLSCAAWLREEHHLNNSTAWSQVRLARQLADLPRTRTAFAAGFLSSQHAMAIARTVDRVVVGGGRAQDAEPLLVDEAMRRTPSDLICWGRHLRHRLNPQELADEEEEQHRRRWLNLTRNWWDGSFELEAQGPGLGRAAGARRPAAAHHRDSQPGDAQG